MGIFWILAVCGCATIVAAAPKTKKEYVPSIDGMQGISIRCDDARKLDLVREFEGLPGFDFLQMPRSGEVRLLVTREHQDYLKRVLEANEIAYEVFVEDVKPIVEAQFAQKRRAASQRALFPQVGYGATHFPDYDHEIVRYLQHVVQKYSDVASLFNIGKSSERRDILGVRISTGPGPNGAKKPAVLIDAGIHAREWIAPSTALYAIHQLTANATGNADVLDYVDFYVIPVLNPDGYQFTHSSPQNRMWRKTRSVNPGSYCRGVDANRNFGVKWNAVGASQNPCSEIYSGARAFSEPEAENLKKFVLAHPGEFKVYLSFHSYGQMILHPWGFTEDLPSNEPTLRCAGVSAEREISKHRGTHFKVGSSTRVLYAAAGGSDDWTMAVGGVNISYTVELPGKGYNGFAPGPEEILPVGIETFSGIRSFGKFAAGQICQ